jgi:hypothetical protein
MTTHSTFIRLSHAQRALTSQPELADHKAYWREHVGPNHQTRLDGVFRRLELHLLEGWRILSIYGMSDSTDVYIVKPLAHGHEMLHVNLKYP